MKACLPGQVVKVLWGLTPAPVYCYEDTPYTNVIFEFLRLDQSSGAGTAPPTPAIAGTSVQAVFPNRADRKLSTLQATDEFAGRIQTLKEENGPYSSELRDVDTLARIYERTRPDRESGPALDLRSRTEHQQRFHLLHSAGCVARLLNRADVGR